MKVGGKEIVLYALALAAVALVVYDLAVSRSSEWWEWLDFAASIVLACYLSWIVIKVITGKVNK
jgi:hypothetical protein